MAIDTTKKIKQVTYNGTEIPLRGYDTSDATVTAGDMARNVIAYGKDGKVAGNVETVARGAYRQFIPKNNSVAQSAGDALMVTAPVSSAVLFRAGSKIRSLAKLDNFGNATAADVAKGKTFTSAAGLKVVGTAEAETAEVISFTIINDTTSDISIAFLDEQTGELAFGSLVSYQQGDINAPTGSQVIVYNTIAGQSWDFRIGDGTEFKVGQTFVDETTGVLTVASNLTGKDVFVQLL